MQQVYRYHKINIAPNVTNKMIFAYSKCLGLLTSLIYTTFSNFKLIYINPIYFIFIILLSVSKHFVYFRPGTGRTGGVLGREPEVNKNKKKNLKC